MNREVHVRFWESAELRCSAPLAYRQEYRGMTEALASISEFIDRTYNQRRLHSALGYRPPEEFERIQTNVA
jgi:transposase InsO family protein